MLLAELYLYLCNYSTWQSYDIEIIIEYNTQLDGGSSPVTGLLAELFHYIGR